MSFFGAAATPKTEGDGEKETSADFQPPRDRPRSCTDCICLVRQSINNNRKNLTKDYCVDENFLVLISLVELVRDVQSDSVLLW